MLSDWKKKKGNVSILSLFFFLTHHHVLAETLQSVKRRLELHHIPAGKMCLEENVTNNLVYCKNIFNIIR